MKQKGLLMSTAIILFVLVIFGSSLTVFAGSFKDVKKGSPHYDGISWLYDKGIDGYVDGTFGTYRQLTRAQAAKMFTTVLDLDIPKASKVKDYFKDVDPDIDYDKAEYVAAATKAGIFSKENDHFHPHNYMKREQMATTLVRAYELESGQNHKSINLQNVSGVHREQVQILADLEITDQLDDFRPLENISRGQFATLLYRANKEKGIQTKYETQHYSMDFSTMLDRQMAMSTMPQTDSAGNWYDASERLTAYYANPNNFRKDSSAYFQFLKLSGSSGVSTDQLNRKILNGKGALEGKAKAFQQASETRNVNEIYLVAHALHETGNGKSKLAKGIEVGKNKKGKPVLVKDSNRDKLKHIKKVYNFFGIKANDADALKNGAKFAYEEGWVSPKKAITGGATYIARDYIARGQDTLYKMRWNPDNPGVHQYATDAGWAVKQTADIMRVYDLLQEVDDAVITFEVPEYNNQPAGSDKPTGVDVFHVNTEHKGKKAKVNEDGLHLRKGPTTSFPAIKTLSKGTKITIIGENADWYKIKAGKQEGWVCGEYLKQKKKK